MLSTSRYLLLPFHLKLSNSCCVMVTMLFVTRPVGYLTLTGAVGCTSASTAILCIAAFHISTWNTAVCVVANAHLCDMLHLFVLSIQAGAGDAMPEEFDKRVIVTVTRLVYFGRIEERLSLLQLNCDVLLEKSGISSKCAGKIVITFNTEMCTSTQK